MGQKISTAGLVGTVTDSIKLATGQAGDLAISVGQLKTYILASVVQKTGTITAGELAYWYADGTLTGLPVTTYPNLTEISYVKGATGNLQQQIDAIPVYTYGNGLTATLASPYTVKLYGQLTEGDTFIWGDGSNSNQTLWLGVDPDFGDTSLSGIYSVSSYVQMYSGGPQLRMSSNYGAIKNFYNGASHSIGFVHDFGLTFQSQPAGYGTYFLWFDHNNNRIYVRANPTTGFKGLQYYDNYAANFTARSLVDKAYVDSLVGAAASPAGGANQIQYNSGSSPDAFAANANFYFLASRYIFFKSPSTTLNDGSSLLNNVEIFGEEHTINAAPSGGGTITDAAVFGWHNEIGNQVGFYSGSSSFTAGSWNKNYAVGAFVAGQRARANYSLSGGFVVGLNLWDDTSPYVTISGASVNISHNTTSQTDGHGALGDYSAIIGGQDHNIPSDSARSAIIGGNGIKARATDPDQVYVPNLNIDSTPSQDDTLEDLLARSSTGLIKRAKVIWKKIEISISGTTLRAINTTPYEVIPAPGAGKVVCLLAAYSSFKYVTAAYDFPSTAGLIYAGGSGNLVSLSNGFLTTTADDFLHSPISNVSAVDDAVNKAVQLKAAGGDATTGSGVLKMTVIYLIHDFAT